MFSFSVVPSNKRGLSAVTCEHVDLVVQSLRYAVSLENLYLKYLIRTQYCDNRTSHIYIPVGPSGFECLELRHVWQQLETLPAMVYIIQWGLCELG